MQFYRSTTHSIAIVVVVSLLSLVVGPRWLGVRRRTGEWGKFYPIRLSINHHPQSVGEVEEEKTDRRINLAPSERFWRSLPYDDTSEYVCSHWYQIIGLEMAPPSRHLRTTPTSRVCKEVMSVENCYDLSTYVGLCL